MNYGIKSPKSLDERKMYDAVPKVQKESNEDRSKRHKIETALLKGKSIENGFIELKGTRKQINWALSIRQRTWDKFNDAIEDDKHAIYSLNSIKRLQYYMDDEYEFYNRKVFNLELSGIFYNILSAETDSTYFIKKKDIDIEKEGSILDDIIKQYLQDKIKDIPVKTSKDEIYVFINIGEFEFEFEPVCIGKISRVSKRYYYESFEYWKNKQFDAFSEDGILYQSNSLFSDFACRIPHEESYGIEDILHKYGLTKYNAFDLLKASGGKLDTDRIFFI